MPAEQMQYLGLDRIVAQPQVREQFDDDALAGLAATMQQVGQLQPVRVRKEGQKFILVDGERRYRAARKAGLSSIAAIVEDKDLDEAEVLQRQLISDCQRADFSAMEKAKGIAAYMATKSCTAAEAASQLGMSAPQITRLLSLLKLPVELQKRVASGEVPASAAYELAKIEDAVQQNELAQQVTSGTLNRDGVAGARKAGQKKPDETATPMGRATAVLGVGRSITVASSGLDLESFISLLEELLAKARKVRPTGIALATFMKMLRDQAVSD